METFLEGLVTEQRRQGLDARVLVHGQPKSEDPEWVVRVPVQVQWVYAPIALGFRSALRHMLDDFRPDVLHLHLPNNACFWCLTLSRALRTPWVVHWHSDVLVNPGRRALRIAYLAYRPFERAVLSNAARIIATSPNYLDASPPLQPHRSACAVVPLGLDPTPPLAAETTTTEWQAGVFRLLSIGRLTHYKGFETLIKAVAGTPGLELLIIGEGELRPALEALIQRLSPPGTPPRVRLLGTLNEADKTRLLNDADLFCLASCERTEAFGMVVLEAMRLGRPCLVSDLAGSGLPWLVKESGAGWLVSEPTRVESWQACLSDLPTRRAELAAAGKRGRVALENNFAMAACERGLRQQYAQCAEWPAPRRPDRPMLVVIPARDEVETITTLIGQLRAAGHRDVLVIDDHSQDGTGVAALAAGAQVIRPVLPLGAWGGMQTGIRYGLRAGYGHVLTMDADGQHEVQEIAKLLAASPHSDVVVGAFPDRASHLRLLAWAWFRRLSGFDLRDLTSGFRLYNREAMIVMASPAATQLDYQDVGALLMIRRAGLTIEEVPVQMQLRQSGKSRIFHSWFSVLKYMAVTTLLCLSHWELPSTKPRSKS
ncbi:MAG: glycosyltransferase, partial [Curvibacter sp.]